jgi:hypothetical protein
LATITKHDQFVRKHLWKYVDASYAYEDFRRLGGPSTQPHPSYNEALEKFGVPPCEAFTAGRLKKQANQQSKEAIADFRRYIGDIE